MLLATTALDITEHKSDTVFALHPGCLLYSRWNRCEEEQIETLPPALVTYRDFQWAYGEITSTYEKLLPELGEALNSIQSVSFSERYWRIVAGPWLEWFIGVVAERYISLEKAMRLRTDWRIQAYASSSPRAPVDSREFIEWVKGDVCNSRLYGEIASRLGIPVTYSYASTRESARVRRPLNWRRMIRAIAACPFQRWRPSTSLLLCSAYLGSQVNLALIFKTLGRVRPGLDWVPPTYLSGDVDVDLRSRLGGMLDCGGNKFYDVARQLLPNYIPTCLLENYSRLRQAASTWLGSPPHAVLTANAFYFNEPFQVWAAEAAERGTKLIALQHGGSFKLSALQPWADHEMKISDTYFQWGECKRIEGPQVKAMPSQNLLRHRKKKTRGGGSIVFVGTTTPRYQLFMQPLYSPHGFLEYLEWRHSFVNLLSRQVRSQLLVRPHPEDLGWEVKARMDDACGEIHWDDNNEPFLDLLMHAELHVCDYLGTTYVESLGLNVPTLIFIDPKLNVISKAFEGVFEELRKVSVVHYSPEGAADTLNQVIHRIPEWWMEPERQAAVSLFREMAVGDIEHGLETWYRELSVL